MNQGSGGPGQGHPYDEPHSHVIHEAPTLEMIASNPHSPEGVLARELLALRKRIEELERNAPIRITG